MNAGASSKAKKSNTTVGEQHAAASRPPPRLSTVQKFQARLQGLGSGGDRRSRPDAFQGVSRAREARPADPEEPASRDSSPGIEALPPPAEPPTPPPPPSPPPRRPPKRTAAQVFRELARCKKEQEEELRRIAALEFVPVAEEVVNKKAIELEEQVSHDRAERRILALLSLENSLASKDKSLEDKKKLGKETNEEKRRWRQLLSELREQEQLIADQLKNAVQSMRDRAREAVLAAVSQKTADARQFGEENLTMVREAQKQREEEREQRARLIEQIRELEAIPLPHFKELDLTQTAGHGLLNEMSIVELRERLALLNMQRAADLQEKNEKILNEKKIQEEQIKMAEEVLKRFHQVQAYQRRQKQERAAQPAPPVTSERLEQLQLEYEEKRAERLRRAARRRAERNERRLARTLVAPPATAVRSAPAAPQQGVVPEKLDTVSRVSRSESSIQFETQTKRLVSRQETIQEIGREFV